MVLLNLPIEVLQTILEYASSDVGRTQLYSYRLVNQLFEIQINRLCWKKQCWEDKSEWYENVPGLPDFYPAFVYSEYSAAENELRATIPTLLLSSQPIVNDLQLDLRIAMAVLMNTKELTFGNDTRETSPGNFKFPLTESDGLFERYREPDLQNRFLKIVDLLVATICYVSGSGLSCSNWYPRRVIDELGFVPRKSWDDMQIDVHYAPNLDWALAVTAYIDNTAAFESILSVFHVSNGTLELSPRHVHRNTHSWGWTHQRTSDPTWVSALTVAIRKGNYELATSLLSNCRNLVNAYTLVPPHENALEIACQQGSLQMVDLILDPHWGLDYTSWHAYYAIQNAARCGCLRDGIAKCHERIAIIHTLLPLMSPERNPQKLKNEILRQACKWGCMTLVRTMIEDLGADPANFDGTALGCAAMHGHVEIMEYLLNQSTEHLSPFFPVYMVEFMEAGADRDMMTYLEQNKSFILTYGALESAKAQYLLTSAKTRDCPKVVGLLTRGGLRS